MQNESSWTYHKRSLDGTQISTALQSLHAIPTAHRQLRSGMKPAICTSRGEARQPPTSPKELTIPWERLLLCGESLQATSDRKLVVNPFYRKASKCSGYSLQPLVTKKGRVQLPFVDTVPPHANFACFAKTQVQDQKERPSPCIDV